MYRRLLALACGGILLLPLSGCMTLSPSGKEMLRRQSAVSTLDFNEEVKKLALLYPQDSIQPMIIKQADGNVSKGIYLQKKTATKTILYFGPNNNPIVQQHKNVLPYLSQLNVNVIWFDYRGFGFTAGPTNIGQLRSDALHIYDTVQASSDTPVILHGLSIGSILALQVASVKSVEQLVLEGSVTNVNDWIDYSFVSQAYYDHSIPKPLGYLIKPFFKTEPAEDIQFIDNEAILKQYRGALLMLSGKNDWETPPALNELLFQSAQSNQHAQFHTIKDVGHLDTLTSPQAIRVYQQFLQRELPGG